MMQDEFNRTWIIEESLSIIDRYADGILTLRGLHYQLVGVGMTNTIQHYKRVVAAMTQARWDGRVRFETFSDLDREMVGRTEWEETILENKIRRGKEQIGLWMKNYNKNRWENQTNYVEVFIEKKALQGVFQGPCERLGVGLGACKGYPSLTFLHETSERFEWAISSRKNPIILYFGDYDPSGEDIPRSVGDNLYRMGCNVEVRRIALMEDQVVDWGLPPAPVKVGDTRSNTWTGIGQVELDAVKPEQLQTMVTDAIENCFDYDFHDDLMEQEAAEKKEYIKELKWFVKSIE